MIEAQHMTELMNVLIIGNSFRYTQKASLLEQHTFDFRTAFSVWLLDV